VDPSVAASYTFTLHAALWLPVTLLGGFFFWRNHLHMSDIEAARRQEAQEEASTEAELQAELQKKKADIHHADEEQPAPRPAPTGAAPVAPEEVRAI
jgi:hypothetical protein